MLAFGTDNYDRQQTESLLLTPRCRTDRWVLHRLHGLLIDILNDDRLARRRVCHRLLGAGFTCLGRGVRLGRLVGLINLSIATSLVAVQALDKLLDGRDGIRPRIVTCSSGRHDARALVDHLTPDAVGTGVSI